jgi:site-specific recombinase XerD
MKSNVSLWFHLRTSKMNEKNQAPIYLRITVDGKRVELSTGHYILPDTWNSDTCQVKGTKEEAKLVNTSLGTLRNKVLKQVNNLEINDAQVTAEAIKNCIQGVHEKEHTLLELFKYHNSRMKALVGRDYAYGTYQRYLVTIKKVEAFILHKYRKSDISINDLDHAFVTNFEFYLKTKHELENNTAMKYIKNLKTVTKIAIENEWLDRDPFMRFKCTYKDPNREPLTQEELDTMMAKEFSIYRLGVVRDMFVFSCYTGLAYIDIEKLTPDSVTKGIDGNDWITIYRQKTDTRSSIPLLPQAKAVIEKYRSNPEALNRGKLLPMISNQKTNAYLKEIATLCGITKNLIYHMARHTFATTVTLANDVPMETVSFMLGHANITTTQIYSKVIDSKVSNDMQKLQEKLSAKSEVKVISLSA